MDINNFIDSMNCFSDLHCHLDGAISVENAKDLAKLQNIELNMTDEEIGSKLHVDDNCNDLNEYLTKFDFPCSLMMTSESLTLATKNLLKELKNDGLIYVELRFAPQLMIKKSMSMEDSVLAVLKGMREVNDIYSNLILCMMRADNNEKENFATIDLANKYKNDGVVAVDLAGAEAIYKNELFDKLFNYANDLKLNLIIHSGEAAGPDSVHSALKYNPKRIGHGVRSYEDDKVVEELSNNKSVLELCPTSNLHTKIFDDIKKYPLRLYMDKGIICTINTDNKSVSNTNIKKEYKLLANNFLLNEDEIKTLMTNSIKYSFADEEIKQKIYKMINEN